MAKYLEVEKNVERVVDIYECGDCGCQFTCAFVPNYCPGCGEELD